MPVLYAFFCSLKRFTISNTCVTLADMTNKLPPEAKKVNVSIRLYPGVIMAIKTAGSVQSWIETAIHEKLERDDIKVIPSPIIR